MQEARSAPRSRFAPRCEHLKGAGASSTARCARILGRGRRRRGRRPGPRILLSANESGPSESARNLVAGILDLGRTRFELFGTELRER